MRSSVLTAAVLASLLTSWAAADTPDQIRKQLADTLAKIQTISVEYQVACERPDEFLLDPRIDAKGRFVLEAFRWRHDRQRGWSYFNGERFANIDGAISYRWHVFAWDGEMWTSYSGNSHRALLDGKPGEVLDSKTTLTSFLGDNLIAPVGTSVLDILEKGDALRVTTKKDGCQQLECKFNLDLKPKPSSVYWYRLTVDLDPQHGGMPSKIVIYERQSEKPFMVLEVTKFLQVDDAVWIPVEGNRTVFQNNFTEDPILLGQLEAASSEAEKLQIARKFNYDKTRKLGAGTMYFSANPSSVEVNKPYLSTDFRFSLPQDAGFLDLRDGSSRRSTTN